MLIKKEINVAYSYACTMYNETYVLHDFFRHSETSFRFFYSKYIDSYILAVFSVESSALLTPKLDIQFTITKIMFVSLIYCHCHID